MEDEEGQAACLKMMHADLYRGLTEISFPLKSNFEELAFRIILPNSRVAILI